MKLTIAQTVLSQALAMVQGVVEKKTTMPILSNVLFRAVSSDRLMVMATDLDLFIQAEFEAVFEDRGDICFHARDVFDVVKQLSPGPVTLTVEDDRQLAVRQGKTVYRFNTIPGEDYPSPPALKDAVFQTIPAQSLGRLAKMTLFATAIDDPRVYLNGAHVEVAGDQLRFVATDGHRMVLCEEPLPEGGFKMGEPVIVPRKAMNEVLRRLEGLPKDTQVELTFTKGLGSMRVAGVQLTFRLIEGRFPDYTMVIPRSTSSHLLMVREELHRALKRLQAMSGLDFASAIIFECSAENLVLRAQNPEKGSGVEEIAVQFDAAEPMRVGFNPRYMIDLVGLLESESLRIGFNDPVAPTLVTMPGDESFRCVIMPIDLHSSGF